MVAMATCCLEGQTNIRMSFFSHTNQQDEMAFDADNGRSVGLFIKIFIEWFTKKACNDF